MRSRSRSMCESMRCVACGSQGLKMTPMSLLAAPIHTSDRLSSSQIRMWCRMRAFGPGSTYARSCGRLSKYCVLTGALMAGRLAIAAVTSFVTARTDGFCARTQPALANALSTALAVPSSKTLNGSPSTVPARFSVRGTNGGSAGRSALPPFVPRTENRAGTVLGDPFNVLLLGTASAVDSAFASAGWVRAQKPSVLAVTKEVTAAIASRPAISAPVSTQYFESRPQDLAYELPGPNARIRHHIRIWLLDSLSLVWIGAANKDIGVIFKPWEPQATHRIDSHIDRERDRIVHDLEASGCADLVDYTTLPGAVTQARNTSGQKIVSDGRTAVVRLRPCGPSPVAVP